MRKTLAVASIALIGTFALAGCSAIDDAVRQVTEKSFADYAEAKDGDWPGVFPDWLPEDATDIHIRTTNDGKVAMLSADTKGTPIGDCEDTERRQLAVWETDWTPEKIMPDRVIACGDWETTPTDDGIFAWYTEQPK